MKIKAIVPWFGSKRNLAPKIVEILGPHRVYWEPFCGSMAVLMIKPVCVMETVNDLNADLINLAKIISDPGLGAKLYRQLRRTFMCEQLYNEAADRHKERGYYAEIEKPDLDRAYDYFVCSWIGRNGVIGTQSYNQGFCVRYTSKGGHAAKRWQSAIGSISAWRRRLSNVIILQRDAFELLEKIEDRKGTVIYIDPPYIEKGAKYIHDFEPDEHERLAGLLRRFNKTRIVVSYYDHEKLNELYPGWRRYELSVTKAMASQNKRGANTVKAKEVILVNEFCSVQRSLWEP